MSVLLATSGLTLLAMLGVSVLNLLTARRLSSAPPPVGRPRVSLLVPARNEEAALGRTLPHLLATNYPNLEIVVLDDCSSDGTAALVQDAARGHATVRLLRGTPLPAGWLGKCWACHQLASHADGDILIFCDADVEVQPLAVQRTVGSLQAAGAGLLTALPRQVTPGLWEAAVVPLIAQLPVIALLPLRLVEKTRSPSLAMGNGQWLAFTRDAYLTAGGHGGVRADILEDVALARAVKASGARLVVALAATDLAVRMYGNTAALRAGFQKNLYALGGGHPASFAIVVAIFGLSMIYPLVAPLHAGVAGAMLLVLLGGIRIVGALALRHTFTGALLHPLGALLTLALAVDSAVATRRGSTSWKGRPVTAWAGESRTRFRETEE